MPKDSKKNTNKPNSAFWGFAVPLVSVFLKVKYKYKKNKNVCEGIKPPFIVLGNHPTTVDPFSMGCSFYPNKINFLTSKYFFFNKNFYKFLKLIGCIPKTQFAADISAVKSILNVLKNDGVIGIFLEGRSSVDGSNGIYSKATAGLLKKMKVPVIAMRFDGAYISKPRWSKTPFYGGYTEISSKVLFTKEELAEMDENEIYSRIVEYMSYDDYEWNRVKKHKYKNPRLAEGLESILFRCPKCNTNLNMATEKRRIYCKNCGNEAIMDNYGLLNAANNDCVIFDTPVKWNRWQKEWMKEQIADDNFSIMLEISNIKRGIEFGKGFENVGNGSVTLTKEGLTLDLTIDNEPYKAVIPIQSLSGISVKAKTGEFEITHNNTTMLLLPAEKGNVNIFDLAIQCLVENKGE